MASTGFEPSLFESPICEMAPCPVRYAAIA